jgi:glucose/arabinose dehydrogenase
VRRRLAGVAVGVAIAVVAGACSGDNRATESAPSATAAATTTVAATAAPTPTTATSASGSTAVASSAAPTSAAATPASTAPGPSDTPDLDAAKIAITKVAELHEPIFVTTRPGDAATTYIAQRGGQLRAFRDGELVDAPVLDISGMIAAGGERGFLGVAFSPDGSHVYVDYTDTNGDTNVDEYSVAADGSVDAASRRQVLFQPQPYPNHNGGEVIFGPDGYLYIGLGDGGSGGDPHRNGMNVGTWLGKILRIDPRPNGDQPYTVPADNPFVGQTGAKPEIWSYGLRNPWRFSFDAATNDLWIADVGQGNIEEVDRSAVADGAGKGVNFGWSAFEGRSRYNADQPTDGTVAPLFQYTHDNGNCSITGGFVYRGTAIPALRGAYLFSDYCAGQVRALAVGDDGEPRASVVLSSDPRSVASYGEGHDHELYICSLDGDAVYRIDPA